MEKGFAEFNKEIEEMIHVMIDALRKRFPTGKEGSPQHVIGATVVMLTTGLAQLPEKERLDLVLLLVPKLLKLAGADCALIEVDKPIGDVWLRNTAGNA